VIRRLRLTTGLVMFAYVTGHLLNHGLGLVSLPLMEMVRHDLYVFWTDELATSALYGSFAIHYGLALWALWQRRSLRMPPAEATQLVLGFSIPFLLTEHVIQTRVADTYFDANFGYYSSLLEQIWVATPWRGVLQLAVLIIAWVHAVIGLRFVLSLRPWYERWQPVLFALALLVPTVSMLGYAEAGQQIAALSQDPAWLAQLRHDHPGARPADQAFLDAMVVWVRWGFLAALLAVLAGRVIRRYWQRRHGIVRLTYPNGRVVQIVPGLSVLEASRMAGIPHASVCGGRGRCSTCRIRVSGDPRELPPPSPEETKVLERVGAAPNVRLACQLRPTKDLTVTPLLPATVRARAGFRTPSYLTGSEREVAILFADLRAFTRLSEQKLPYDIVFLLNRYFAEMGQAVEEAGGRVDKFIGDGVMALFGLDRGIAHGCREALVAARSMSERVAHLNEVLVHDLPEPLRVGIGIHTGHAIVGEMGYGKAMSLTAVGDSVNVASRLEGHTKNFDAELVISEAVVTRAGVMLDNAPQHEIEIRGRVDRLSIRAIKSARDLPDLRGVSVALPR